MKSTLLKSLFKICTICCFLPTSAQQSRIQIGQDTVKDQKFFLELDGVNQYAESTNCTSGLSEATIMGWIKIDNSFTTNSFLFGANNFNLKITSENGLKIIGFANGQSILSQKNLEKNRWYHVALLFNGNSEFNKLQIYINGVAEASENSDSLTGNLSADMSNFTIGRNPSTNEGFFKGGLDEIRIFNKSLSEDNLRKMIYQEIKQNGSFIIGTVIPKNIETLDWSSLLACYSFNDFNHNLSRNLKNSDIDENNPQSFTRIFNVKNLMLQSAPMPFTSIRSGHFNRAFSRISEVNESDATLYDWSIIRISHDVEITANQTSLGFIVDHGATLKLTNNNKLENTWYLKIDGKIDLESDAQLIQTSESDLDLNGVGFIERDQQGQSNKFNYNYWSSPVGAINNETNNHDFKVSVVMFDGTDPENIQPINWTSSLDSQQSNPITLSNYWIYKYQNFTSYNSNWQNVGPHGTLLPGQGFTLKGSSAETATQNYSFVGKPNNGTITSPIIDGNLNLCGNPYPSALDADTFILNNKNIINGTLYFYEQFSYNNTHNLANYQSGYATRNLVGGVPAISITGQSINKTPGRYIPVAQGFIVKGKATGFLEFNNSQRVFVHQYSPASQPLFRNDAAISTSQTNNDDDAASENSFQKIRIGMDSADQHHRQILLGFMNENATAGIDTGYDAVSMDYQPNDLSFIVAGNKLVIQGDGFYDVNKSYPLSVKSGAFGNIKIVLDGTENFSDSQQILIYDNETGISTNLRSTPFEVYMPIGTFDNRFSLRFLNAETLVNQEFNNENTIAISYTNGNQKITISNTTNFTVENVSLYNMPGQNLGKWTVANLPQSKIQLPVIDLSTGTYIVKVQTTNAEITKMIVIQ